MEFSCSDSKRIKDDDVIDDDDFELDEINDDKLFSQQKSLKLSNNIIGVLTAIEINGMIDGRVCLHRK